jgi:hypothetical protein
MIGHVGFIKAGYLTDRLTVDDNLITLNQHAAGYELAKCNVRSCVNCLARAGISLIGQDQFVNFISADRSRRGPDQLQPPPIAVIFQDGNEPRLQFDMRPISWTLHHACRIWIDWLRCHRVTPSPQIMNRWPASFAFNPERSFVDFRLAHLDDDVPRAAPNRFASQDTNESICMYSASF